MSFFSLGRHFRLALFVFTRQTDGRIILKSEFTSTGRTRWFPRVISGFPPNCRNREFMALCPRFIGKGSGGGRWRFPALPPSPPGQPP